MDLIDEKCVAEIAQNELLFRKYARLHSAAYQLYMSGNWVCQQINPVESALLWENLRDAMQLQPGEAVEVSRDRRCSCPNSYTADPACQIHGYKASAKPALRPQCFA